MNFSLAKDDDEYELLPRHEIEYLKRELERLKKHPFGDLKEGETLLEAVNNLNNSINKLINIFTKANADLAKEYSENSPSEQISTIKEQNDQIAEGLIAIADMVNRLKQGTEKPSFAPQTPSQIPPIRPAPLEPGNIPPPPEELDTHRRMRPADNLGPIPKDLFKK